MKKSLQLTIGIGIIIVATILLGADRIFVSADTTSFVSSVTLLTTISIIFFLVGAIWLFIAITRKEKK